MRDNRIFAVHDPGIIPALVKHAGVGTDDRGKINCPSHCALVRTDNRDVIPIDGEIRDSQHQGTEKLVGRKEIIKVSERRDALDPGVMGVKGNEIVDAHINQLAEHQRTVQ